MTAGPGPDSRQLRPDRLFAPGDAAFSSWPWDAPGSGTAAATAQTERLTGFVALLLRLAGRFINLPLASVDAEIDRALADTGAFVGADRAYCFSYDLGAGTASNTHEWCAAGVEPHRAQLQDLPMSEVPEWAIPHLRGEAVHVADVQQLPQGRQRDLLEGQGIRTAVALPLSGHGGCTGFVGFDFVREQRTLGPQELELLRLFAQMLVNVGERARADAELGRLNATLESRVAERTRELAAARDQAEAANREKSELMARISHELRTPLNAVLGFSQLLALDDTLRQSPSALQQVEHIRAAGGHLLALVDDVLDLARIQSDGLKLTPEPVDLGALSREALTMIEPLARLHQVALAGPTGPLPAWARADRTRLRQVVVNLLTNAVKYNRSGGRVQLRIRDDGGRLRLSVSDTGAGLTRRQIASIFEPFNRAGAETGSVEGTGLGLSIARQLMQAMDGTLAVTSRPGHGSRFTLGLPAAGTGTTCTSPAPAREPVPARVAVPLRLLYVEDNPVNLVLMEAVLARPEFTGVTLRTCVDGVEGLAAALADPPDLVLLDLTLPGLSGFELRRRLAGDPATASVPCVAVSANALPAEISHALQEGFAAYLAKPFTLQDLAGLLARFAPAPGPAPHR